jgi:hypothetical protein
MHFNFLFSVNERKNKRDETVGPLELGGSSRSAEGRAILESG